MDFSKNQELKALDELFDVQVQELTMKNILVIFFLKILKNLMFIKKNKAIKNFIKFNDGLFHVFCGIFGLMAGKSPEINTDFIEKDVKLLFYHRNK